MELWGRGPIVAVPALLTSLFFSAMAIDRARKNALAYIAVGLAVTFVVDAIVDGPSYYISESYTFGLIGLLLFLPLLFSLSKHDGSKDAAVFGFTLTILAIPFLMALKVSVGILWGVSVGWVALRRYGISVTTVMAGLGSLAALAVGLVMFSPGTGDYIHNTSSRFELFYYFRLFPEVRSFSSLLIPLCFVLIRIADARADRVKGAAGNNSRQVGYHS